MAKMGLGNIGLPTTIFKRKFRWRFEVTTTAFKVEPHYVKVASRPNITVEETEVHFLNGITYIPGKGKYEAINVTYHDVSVREGAGNRNLFNWLASVYQFNNKEDRFQGVNANDYAGEGKLTMYDGAGNPMEEWIFQDLWPTSINFGDLDYQSQDICEIALTLRYSGATYKSLCPAFTPVGKYGSC